MTITKTPLKFPYQAEQKILILYPSPQHKWNKSVTDIILPILESVESANPQKEYVVYNRGTFSDWHYPSVYSTIDAHYQ